MVTSGRYFRRHVHISDRRGGISVRIKHQDSRGGYFLGMCLCTVFFIAFCHVLLGASWQHAVEFLYALPWVTLGLAWYVTALALCVWGAFGVEELSVEGSALRWTRKALRWSRTRDVPVGDITDIIVVNPWHGRYNTVELITRGKRETIGGELLYDEATDLAHRLRQALGLPERSRDS